jgi:hypothetical protein
VGQLVMIYKLSHIFEFFYDAKDGEAEKGRNLESPWQMQDFVEIS